MKKIETIFAKNFERNYEKTILGTSDAWSMRRSSHRPINPAYYIEDCWISNLGFCFIETVHLMTLIKGLWMLSPVSRPPDSIICILFGNPSQTKNFR